MIVYGYLIKPRAYLHGANLSGTNLCGADLRKAYLYEANLRGADLRGTNLCGADLRKAYLYEANLRGANLRGADLRGTNLSGADLRVADLRGAELNGANLYGVDSHGANLYGAKLCGAKFSNNKWPNTQGNWETEVSRSGTIWAKGYRSRHTLHSPHRESYGSGNITEAFPYCDTSDLYCQPGIYLCPSMEDALYWSDDIVEIWTPLHLIHSMSDGKYRTEWVIS